MTQIFSNINTVVISNRDNFEISIGDESDADVAMSLIPLEDGEVEMVITQKNLPRRCLSSGMDLKHLSLVAAVKCEKGSLYHVIPKTEIIEGATRSEVPYVPGIDGYMAVCQIFLVNEEFQIFGSGEITMDYPRLDGDSGTGETPSQKTLLPTIGRDLDEFAPWNLIIDNGKVLIEYNRKLFREREFHNVVFPLIFESVVREVFVYLLASYEETDYPEWLNLFENHLFKEIDADPFNDDDREDAHHSERLEQFKDGWKNFITSGHAGNNFAETLEKISELLRDNEDE